MILVKKINLLFQGIWLNRALRKSIRRNLEYIFVFPEFKKRLLYHPKNFFFQPSKDFYYLCEYKTQKAAEEILAYCGLDKISVRVTYDYLDITKDSFIMPIMLRNDPPGKIYQLNRNQYTIYAEGVIEKKN